MTRPRKRVLLFCADEQRAAELAFVLNTAPKLAVAKACSDAQFQYLLQATWDLVAVVHAKDMDATEERCTRARVVNDRPVLVLGIPPEDTPCWANLALSNLASVATTLQAMQSLCARKRGPKKGFKRVEALPQLAQTA